MMEARMGVQDNLLRQHLLSRKDRSLRRDAIPKCRPKKPFSPKPRRRLLPKRRLLTFLPQLKKTCREQQLSIIYCSKIRDIALLWLALYLHRRWTILLKPTISKRLKKLRSSKCFLRRRLLVVRRNKLFLLVNPKMSAPGVNAVAHYKEWDFINCTNQEQDRSRRPLVQVQIFKSCSRNSRPMKPWRHTKASKWRCAPLRLNAMPLFVRTMLLCSGLVGNNTLVLFRNKPSSVKRKRRLCSWNKS
mmetsp:Transcript_39986/g.83201  ORF Transcript_39986/g.83201 Transcript_39986/m.83201 type:complete len:245 (-) Transcript_39986:3020-3754(-)